MKKQRSLKVVSFFYHLNISWFLVSDLRFSFSKLKLLVDDVIFFFALTRFRSSYYMVWLDRIYDIVIKDNYTN